MPKPIPNMPNDGEKIFLARRMQYRMPSQRRAKPFALALVMVKSSTMEGYSNIINNLIPVGEVSTHFHLDLINWRTYPHPHD
jgi:hypothetical protein